MDHKRPCSQQSKHGDHRAPKKHRQSIQQDPPSLSPPDGASDLQSDKRHPAATPQPPQAASSAAAARSYRDACRACDDGRLFACVETLACAAAGCVPCAYKLVVQPGPASAAAAAAGHGGPAFLPNRRPEECLRMLLLRRRRSAGGGGGDRTAAVDGDGPSASPAGLDDAGPGRAGLYRAGQRILTLGDGDLSFSVGLARALLPPPKGDCAGAGAGAGGSGGGVAGAAAGGGALVATTYLSRAALEAAYGAEPVRAAVRALRERGAVVLHEVSAARPARSIAQRRLHGRTPEPALPAQAATPLP